MTTTHIKPAYLDRDAAARYVSLSVITIERMVARGDFPAEKGYFDGLVEYVAAVHPRTVLRLLDRISELEAKLDATESRAM